MQKTGPVHLVALGNTVMSDDGAGPWVLRQLAKKKWPCPVTFHHSGTASQYCRELFSDKGVIFVVDALRTGRPPGTVVSIPAGRLWLDDDFFSLHDLHLLNVASRFYPHRLDDIHVFGIEPLSLEPGTSLSDIVKQGLPLLTRAVALALRKAGKIEIRAKI